MSLKEKMHKSVTQFYSQLYGTKSRDYENSVNRYASWAYQETFLVFLLNFFGFTVKLKKCKEGHTHRFARIQTIYYDIETEKLQTILGDSFTQVNDLPDKHQMEEINETEIISNSQSECMQQSPQQHQTQQDQIPLNPGTTRFVLFEDTEYFEGLCSSQRTKTSGSKNINDFAKTSSLFMMYLFNTFGIQFHIKGEGKTFPVISEIVYGNSVISHSDIQDFGRRHFSEMMKGIQFNPATIVAHEEATNNQRGKQLKDFLLTIQSGLYQEAKAYILFVKFISEKFYNLYCNDNRTCLGEMSMEEEEKYRVVRSHEINDEHQRKTKGKMNKQGGKNATTIRMS